MLLFNFEKYSFVNAFTLGAKSKPEITVGIDIKAKALSIRLIAKSIFTTAAMTIETM